MIMCARLRKAFSRAFSRATGGCFGKKPKGQHCLRREREGLPPSSPNHGSHEKRNLAKDGYTNPSISSPDVCDSAPLTWESVTKQVSGARWDVMPQSDFDETWAEVIRKRFQLNYRPGTRFIWENGTNATVCLCEEGVFSFSMDFESAFLISSSLQGALEYMTSTEKQAEGPMKNEGKPYFSGKKKVALIEVY